MRKDETTTSESHNSSRKINCVSRRLDKDNRRHGVVFFFTACAGVCEKLRHLMCFQP